MLKSPYKNSDKREEAYKDLAKLLLWIWVLLCIGLVIEALKINPSKVSYSGIEFELKEASSISGLVYLTCLSLYIVGFFMMFLIPFAHGSDPYDLHRKALYACAGKRRTLAKLTRREVYITKYVARGLIRIIYGILLVPLVAPLLILVVFKWRQILLAIKMIVTS